MDFDLIPRLMSLTGAREPEVVAGVAAMLASEDAAHITGEDIRVDGGTLSLSVIYLGILHLDTFERMPNPYNHLDSTLSWHCEYLRF